jgi:hypothetical protein
LASLLGRFLGILRSFLAQTCPAEGVEGMTKPEQLRWFDSLF